MLHRARRCAILLAAILCGCSTIGHEKVAGWPALRVVEHHVSNNVMRDRCAKYVGFGMSPEACAEFNFAAGVCDIWLSADFPPAAYVVEHERDHCLGYEHVGEHELGNILARAGLSPAVPAASQAAAAPNTLQN